MQQSAQELEEAVARLLSRMSPAMSPDCPKPEKNPSGPEPCLPDLGNAIRNVRTTVNRTIAEVRSAIDRVEL